MTTTTSTGTLQYVCVGNTPEPYYPWVQQPRSAYAVSPRFLTLYPWQCHPFTVASVEEDGQLVLIIKKEHDLTERLYKKCMHT